MTATVGGAWKKAAQVFSPPGLRWEPTRPRPMALVTRLKGPFDSTVFRVMSHLGLIARSCNENRQDYTAARQNHQNTAPDEKAQLRRGFGIEERQKDGAGAKDHQRPPAPPASIPASAPAHAPVQPPTKPPAFLAWALTRS